MGAIEAIDNVNTTEASEKWVSEMKPYTFRWSPSFFSWNSHEVAMLLPADTKYSKGMVTKKGSDGSTSTAPDLVDASSGIPVSSSGKVDVCLISKTEKVQGNKVVISTTTRMVSVSISYLPSKTSKEEFFNQLKKTATQVLSQSENSLLTKILTRQVIGETLVKTVVKGDIVVQFSTTTFGPDKDASLKLLLSKINLV